MFIAERSSTGSSNNSSITASSTPNACLSRSRRSQFGGDSLTTPEKIRILYEYERLVQYSKSPHAWALPAEWTKICLKAPNIVRDKVNKEGARVLEEVYSWLRIRDENEIKTNTPNNTQHVKFQRMHSLEEPGANTNTNSNGSWVRKSFDAKRMPLQHSKSVI